MNTYTEKVISLSKKFVAETNAIREQEGFANLLKVEQIELMRPLAKNVEIATDALLEEFPDVKSSIIRKDVMVTVGKLRLQEEE